MTRGYAVTPLDCAQYKGHKDCINLIEAMMKRIEGNEVAPMRNLRSSRLLSPSQRQSECDNLHSSPSRKGDKTSPSSEPSPVVDQSQLPESSPLSQLINPFPPQQEDQQQLFDAVWEGKSDELQNLFSKFHGGSDWNYIVDSFELPDLGSQYAGYDLTLLHVASIRGHKDIVDILLKKGIAVDVRGGMPAEITPLHLAAAYGHDGCVERLLKRLPSNKKGRESIDVVTIGLGDGLTALALAAKHGHCESVRKLLAAGANKRIQFGSMGKTAYKIAVENGHQECANLLK